MTWQKGQSGNPAGRKAGIRENLTKDFVTDLAEVWKKDGAAALKRLVKDDPSSFCKLAASLVPKDIKIQHNVNLVTDIIRLASQRSVEALEERNNNERVIEHESETLSVDTLNSVTKVS